MSAVFEADSEVVSRHLPTPAATDDLARRVAGRARAGDVIALTGDLGAGKSHFARALITALPQPDGTPAVEHVPSPTFTLVQTYDRLDADGAPVTIWHFDLYRLADPAEVEELGWDEARDGGLVLVEWPDRLGPLAPRDRLDVTLAIPDGGAGTGRTAVLQGGAAWAGRLRRLAAALDATGNGDG